MEANTDKTKYGKLIYSFEDGQHSILHKYADHGRPLPLYKGLMA